MRVSRLLDLPNGFTIVDMSTSIYQLSQKARGTATALAAMTAKQREQELSPIAAKDYNALRALTLEAQPSLEKLLPPPIEVWTSDFGSENAAGRYQDLHAFTQQVVNLLEGAMPRTGQLL